MTTKIFITGGTGYIGGSILHTLSLNPTYNITALLRNPPPSFPTQYPNITILKGDYDSASLLTSEASKSSIVIHNGNSDHIPSLTALIAGLIQKFDTTGEKGYLLHLSGTGILSDWNEPEKLGRLNEKIWSDTSSTDLSFIRTAVPNYALHAPIEKLLHDTIAQHSEKINLAIICPPDIYGRGLGPGKTTSALIPFFVAEIKKLGHAFYVGNGENTRGWVHINDLMRLYTHIVDAAASSLSQPNPSSPEEPSTADNSFNTNGYFFASTQETSQIALARAVGRILHHHGVITDAEPVEIGLEELDTMCRWYEKFPHLARYLFASNSRTRAERAKGLFGYEAGSEALFEGLEGDVLDALG